MTSSISIPLVVGEENIKYDRMVGSFEISYIGLYSEQTKQTDIFKINPFEFTKLNYQTSLEGELSHMMTHRDFLICDYMVLENGQII